VTDLFTRSTTALAERFDDTIVVLDHVSGSSVQLNAAAACVWDALEAPADAGQVAGRLAQRFGLATDRAAADAKAALEGFVERGLVMRTTEPQR